jgi:hypothetical protein
MTRSTLAVILFMAEAALIWTHPDEMRAFARVAYVTGWHLLPTEGMDMPDRFAPRPH